MSREKFPLRRIHIESIADSHKGVYAFWCRVNGRCIYVGKAERQSIKDRLMQEWSNSHNKTLKRWIATFGEHLDICYLPVSRQNRIDRTETTLIKLWNPEANIRKKGGV